MKPGRTKQKMARLLSERLGVQLDPNNFWANRNAEQVGCARWGIWAVINGQNTNVYSWDTMTECLQRGFVLSNESTSTVCVVVDDPA